MKFDMNQRRLYLAALIVLVIAIALVCVWQIWLKNDGNDSWESAPQPTQLQSQSPWGDFRTTEPLQSPENTDTTASNKVDTVVYYQDNYGYLVPVMCNVPLEDGIAKATLSMMVSTSENDMNAARLGLRTVIPENVSMDLDISGGKARIDLSKEASVHPDAVSEANMISAVVQTLTEFDTVKSVEFLFGGQKLEQLPHGTDVSKTFDRGDINLETTAVSASAAGGTLNRLTLYFPGESASVVVPVTRMVYSTPDIDTAVLELTKGPVSDALDEVVPMGCGLIDVSVENGVAKINFTAEFMQIVNNIDGGRLALKALAATCVQFEGVDSVEIYVEGEKWDNGEELAAPSFANIADDIRYEYIQTQSNAIFDGE